MNIETDFFQDLDAALARLKDFKLDEMLNEPECEDAVRQASDLEALQAFVPWLKVAPTKFGQYLLYEKIGEGGMGAVYRAQHIHLQKWVALKVLSARREKNIGAHSQFWREMASLGKLNHPNLVTAHDAGNFDGVQFLVMELVEGVNLQQLVKCCGTLSFPDAAAILLQVINALQYLESRQLLHRDIKPSNVMITASGTVKLLDLGVAQSVQKEWLETRSDFSLAGTLRFMAPELLRQEAEADFCSEIFSLGCTLLFLLTGKSPRRKPSRGETPKTKSSKKTLPVDGHVIIPEKLSGEAKHVLNHLLARHPEDRPQSFSQISDLLDQFVQKAELSKLGTEIEFLLQTNAQYAKDEEISLVLPDPNPSVVSPELAASKNWIVPLSAIILLLGAILFGSVMKDRSLTPEPVEQNSQSRPFTTDPGSRNTESQSDRLVLQELLAQRNNSKPFAVRARNLDTGDSFQFESDAIPKQRKFAVEGFGELQSFAHFSANELEHFSKFQSLQSLFISIPDFNEAFIETLAQCPRVSRIALEFRQTDITSDQFIHFKQVSSLANLFILVKTKDRWEVDQQIMSALGRHTFLTSFTMQGNFQFSDRSSNAWSEFWELKDLHLDGHGLTESAFQEISKLPQLRVLKISSNDLDGKLLPLQFANLSQLQFDGCHDLSDQELKAILKNQSNLKELSLIDAQRLTGDFLRELPNLSTLEILHLVGADNFNSETLVEMRELSNLKHLDLSRTPLNSKSLNPLSKLVQLKVLNLSGTGYSPVLLDQLRLALSGTTIYPVRSR